MALSHALFAALVALVALQRLFELARSRRHLDALAAKGHGAEREPMYLAMVLVHSLSLILPIAEVIAFDRPLSLPITAISLLFLALAQLGRVWVFRTLGGAWNTRVVEPVAIVSTGPYRFVRHPNYLIVCIELFVLPMVHFAWMSAIFLTLANAWVLSKRIPLEESVLARHPEWVRTFRHTPRIVPRRARADA